MKIKSIFYILNNSIPLTGVFIFGWDGIFVVQFCFIEVCIASMFDYVKLPFLKTNPNGETGQGIITGYSIFLLLFMFFISACMVNIFEIKLLPWQEFLLPASALIASYTVQLIHFFAVDRLDPNLYRVDVSKFTVLRFCVLSGAMVLLPWIGILLMYMGFPIRLLDSLKGIIILMFFIRTFFEINALKPSSDNPSTTENL